MTHLHTIVRKRIPTIETAQGDSNRWAALCVKDGKRKWLFLAGTEKEVREKCLSEIETIHEIKDNETFLRLVAMLGRDTDTFQQEEI